MIALLAKDWFYKPEIYPPILLNNNMIRISFTGDILSNIPQNQACENPDGTYDYTSCFGSLDFSNIDYLCGNLETPVAGETLGYTDAMAQFNTPEPFLDALKQVGFDFMSTANNHVMDRGLEGVLNTLDALDRTGLDHTGTYRSEEEFHHIFIKEIEGVKVAFLSFTYGTNSEDHGKCLDVNQEYHIDLLRSQKRNGKKTESQPISINRILQSLYFRSKHTLNSLANIIVPEEKKPYISGSVLDCVDATEFDSEENQKYIENLRNKVSQAKRQADVVILCLHIGGQYNNEIGEYTQKVYNMIKELPIDMVVGNHPHCVLPGRIEAGKFIGYSLGNFSFTPRDGWYNDSVFADYSILLNAYIDKNKKTIDHYTFSIFKVCRNSVGLSQTFDTYDLYQRLQTQQEQDDLLEDVMAVIKRFTNSKYNSIQKEYILK